MIMPAMTMMMIMIMCVFVLSCPSVAWDDMVIYGLRSGTFLVCGYFPPPEADVLVLDGAQQT